MDSLNRLLLETYKRIESSKEPEKELSSILNEKDEGELNELVSESNELPNRKALSLAFRNISSTICYLELENKAEEVFYKALWDSVSANPMFQGEDMQRAAMFALLRYPSLPYGQLNEFEMEWSEYTSRIESLVDECAVMDRLQYREFENAGAAGAAMLDIIVSPSEKRDQVALMTYLMSLLKNEFDEDASDFEG